LTRRRRAELESIVWTRIPGSFQLSLNQQARARVARSSRACAAQQPR
jgi:hypothetical protein